MAQDPGSTKGRRVFAEADVSEELFPPKPISGVAVASLTRGGHCTHPGGCIVQGKRETWCTGFRFDYTEHPRRGYVCDWADLDIHDFLVEPREAK